jgi:hypothetical protein
MRQFHTQTMILRIPTNDHALINLISHDEEKSLNFAEMSRAYMEIIVSQELATRIKQFCVATPQLEYNFGSVAGEIHWSERTQNDAWTQREA